MCKKDAKIASMLTVPIKLAGIFFISVLLLHLQSVYVNVLVQVDFESHKFQPCGYCQLQRHPCRKKSVRRRVNIKEYSQKIVFIKSYLVTTDSYRLKRRLQDKHLLSPHTRTVGCTLRLQTRGFKLLRNDHSTIPIKQTISCTIVGVCMYVCMYV